jgi:hypothetical protein
MSVDEQEPNCGLEEHDRKHRLWLILPFAAFFVLLGVFSLSTHPNFHAFWNKKTADTVKLIPAIPYD